MLVNAAPIKYQSKYRVEDDAWPYANWPTLAIGMGALITPNAVRLLHEQAKYFPITVPHLDDVYLANLVHFSNNYHWDKYLANFTENLLTNDASSVVTDDDVKAIRKQFITTSPDYIQPVIDSRFNGPQYALGKVEGEGALTCSVFNLHPVYGGQHAKVINLRKEMCGDD